MYFLVSFEIKAELESGYTSFSQFGDYCHGAAISLDSLVIPEDEELDCFCILDLTSGKPVWLQIEEQPRQFIFTPCEVDTSSATL